MRLTRIFTCSAMMLLSTVNLTRGEDKVVVPGDPPLTQAMIVLDRSRAEVIFDLSLTEDQRQEFLRCQITDWKKKDQHEKREWARILKNWAELPKWSIYKRNEQRTLTQVKVRQMWAANPTAGSAWLLAIEAEVFKEGSARNPVLVAGQPPLTQLLVDRYGDYLEIIVDLSSGGGFTEMERKILREYLVKAWKTMDAEAKNELIASYGNLAEAAATGGGGTDRYIRAMRPRLFAQLRAAGDDPLSLWLLEVHKHETAVHEWKMAYEKRRHESKLNDIRSIPKGPTGHWEYNSRTRRYEFVDDPK